MSFCRNRRFQTFFCVPAKIRPPAGGPALELPTSYHCGCPALALFSRACPELDEGAGAANAGSECFCVGRDFKPRDRETGFRPNPHSPSPARLSPF
jgi:hypothetical protein